MFYKIKRKLKLNRKSREIQEIYYELVDAMKPSDFCNNASARSRQMMSLKATAIKIWEADFEKWEKEKGRVYEIYAKFIGHTSCGFCSGKSYKLRIIFTKKGLEVRGSDVRAYCLYASLESFNDNWLWLGGDEVYGIRK